MRAAAMVTLLVLGAFAQDPPEQAAALADETSGELVIDRGDDQLALQIRAAEELVYVVEVDLGPFKGISVGDARFITKVEDLEGVLVGSIEGTFKASHLGYKLDQRLLSRHVTGEQLALESSDTQRGSESRRRELRIGPRDGEWVSEYRFDGHCSGCKDKAHFVHPRLPWDKPAHCKKCKRGKHRVWRDMRSRAVPAHTLDFLSVVYLLRSLIESGEQQLQTPLLEKDRLWNLGMEISEGRQVEVPLGVFKCSRVLLQAAKPESEPEGGEFSGLFGMQGSLHLWVHEETGVLVQIDGELPLGPIDLGVKIRLKEAKNLMAEFAPAGG
jgi:hypothetical protein